MVDAKEYGHGPFVRQESTAAVVVFLIEPLHVAYHEQALAGMVWFNDQQQQKTQRLLSILNTLLNHRSLDLFAELNEFYCQILTPNISQMFSGGVSFKWRK